MSHGCRAALLRRSSRRGVTIVELLVTLTIVGILASAVMFAMAGATEAARAAKTRTMIVKLNSLLMERWESYLTRQVPIKTTGLSPAGAADVRLKALRKLMKMEMPDRWSDILLVSVEDSLPNPAAGPPPDPPDTPDNPRIPRPAISRGYWRRYNQISSDNPDVIRQYQSAECLYLVITLATGDGEAMEQFSVSDIGDVDGDGAREFLDGWGNPIRFLRWAPGFRSDLQTGDASRDHDPFDPMQRDERAFRLLPLIYSAGPDGELDINEPRDFLQLNDPYAPDNNGNLLGTKDDVNDGWVDNIHNHVLGLN